MRNTKDPGVNYVSPWLLLGCVGLESPPSVIFIIAGAAACTHTRTRMHAHTFICIHSSTRLIPPLLFFLFSHHIPFHTPAILPFSRFPSRLFHFAPSPASFNCTITDHYKAFDSGSRAATPFLLPPSHHHPPSPGVLSAALVVCACPQGRGGPVTPGPSRWPPLCGDLCV